MRRLRIAGMSSLFLIGGFVVSALSASSLLAPTYLSADVEFQNYKTASWGPKEIRSYLRRNARQYPTHEIGELSQLIYKYSKRYKFEPGLIISILRVESGFQQDAVSPKGAIGLMQLMPDTAGWLAQRIGVQIEDTDDVFEPDVNLHLGVYYLNYLRKLYAGDMKKVLVAYNRGPGSVDEVIHEGGELILGYYHKVRRNFARLTFSEI